MNETLLLVFVIATSVAVVLQMAILFGMFLTTRKLSERVIALSAKVETDVLPLAATVREFVNESGPKVQIVLSNVAETSNIVRAKAVELDAAVTEVVSIARTQANNAGILAERTIQRVDQAAESVQHAVNAPVRQFSAIIEGLAAGFGEYFGARKVRRPKPVPNDEMFI